MRRTTPDKKKKMIELLTSGATIRDACILAEINHNSYYNWIRKDKEFDEATKKALILTKVTCINRIITNQDWKAQAWWLERKFPKEFKRPSLVTNTNITNNITGSDFIEDMTEKELLDELENIRKEFQR